MTFTLSRNHRHFIIANILLLGLIAIFALQKFGPLNNKETLKFFGSRLLYLYLAGCCSAFLVFFYGYFSKNLKRGAWIIVGMFYFSLIGTLLNPYPRIEITHTHAELELIDFKIKDTIDAKISFTMFSQLLKNYLVSAQNGEIKVFLRAFLFGSNIADYQITIGKYNYQYSQYLSKEIIKELLLCKTINIKNEIKQDIYAYLMERDFAEPSKTRLDSLSVNGRKIKLKHDNMLILAFYFETLDGKPLAAFL